MSWSLGVVLAVLGALVAAYGTVIGAGGGFLIVPGLLLSGLATAEQAAGTSLVAVCASAISGSISYGLQRRIDVKTGLWLAAAAIPGSIGGAFLTAVLSGPAFDVAFGVMMLAIAAWVFFRPASLVTAEPRERGAGWVERRLTDAAGTEHVYSFHLPGALASSAAIGVMSSTLGIGGGVILVPMLIAAFGFPAHVATATAQLVLAMSSLLGATAHYTQGHVMVGPAIALAIGAVAGAQLGAKLSTKLKGPMISRMLAIALVLVGARLVARGL